MSYIGLEPSNSFVSLKRQVITGNGGTSYTLDHSVASVNDVAIFVNNVRQDPAGYSISGAALTLGGTIESSDDCYVIFLGQALQTVTPDANTITTAMIQNNAVTTAKITDANVTSAKMFSGFKNGITELDQWRLNADTNTGSNADVTSNWERVDSSGWGKIGTGLSTSSGIFSFSQTGIYRIDFRATFSGSTNDALHRFDLLITLDNSSYNIVAQARGGNIDSSITGQSSGSNVFFFDVTDTSLCKFKFTTASFDGSTFLKGSTTFTQTGFEIMRIGDT